MHRLCTMAQHLSATPTSSANTSNASQIGVIPSKCSSSCLCFGMRTSTAISPMARVARSGCSLAKAVFTASIAWRIPRRRVIMTDTVSLPVASHRNASMPCSCTPVSSGYRYSSFRMYSGAPLLSSIARHGPSSASIRHAPQAATMHSLDPPWRPNASTTPGTAPRYRSFALCSGCTAQFQTTRMAGITTERCFPNRPAASRTTLTASQRWAMAAEWASVTRLVSATQAFSATCRSSRCKCSISATSTTALGPSLMSVMVSSRSSRGTPWRSQKVCRISRQ
mmetsp:Transcript_87219/g.233576  ORF Transcript_87219/g.233576 Transcript_87219/m.233576 type:complete len:281 (-) Transcript_87219:605-1447(-)